jgi:hypothetical protein
LIVMLSPCQYSILPIPPAIPGYFLGFVRISMYKNKLDKGGRTLT